MENPEKCEWNEIDPLKRPNRLKRTTFSSKPYFLVIFRLDQPKICVPFIFYPELPEFNIEIWGKGGLIKKSLNIFCG